MSRIAEYARLLLSSRNGKARLGDIFTTIFRDLDARLDQVEKVATSVAEVEAELTANGQAIVEQSVQPVLDKLKAAADLGVVFTAASVSTVAVGTGLRTFVVDAADRPTFAPGAALAILASADPAVSLWGRKVTYDRTTGVLVVDVASVTGGGSATGWIITPGALAAMAGVITTAPAGLVTATTLQAALAELSDLVAARAPSASPALTGAPTAPTPAAADNSTAIATTAFVKGAIDGLKGGASSALDTLGELAAALAGDAAFSATVTTALGNRYTKAEADAKFAAAALARPLDNAVINGDFGVNDRASQVISITSNYGWICDRWLVQGTLGVGTRSVAREADPTSPGDWLIRYQCTAVANPTLVELLQTKIEGAGTLSGRDCVVAFEARAVGAPGAVAVSLSRYFGFGGSPSAPVALLNEAFEVGTDWTPCVAVIPAAQMGTLAGKTIGSAGGDHLLLRLFASAGSNWDAETSSLGLRSQTVQIRRVRLHEGLAPPGWAPRPRGLERLLCARYFQTLGRGLSAQVASSTAFRVYGTFPVPMRTVPIIEMTTTAPEVVVANSLAAGVSSNYTSAAIDTTGFRGSLGGFSGLTVGQAAHVSTPGLLTFDAEL